MADLALGSGHAGLRPTQPFRSAPSHPPAQPQEGPGFLFLAIVLDVFSHRVIGWAMGPSAELRIGRREGGRRLSGPQPHLRLAGAVGIERGDVVAQPQAAII